MRQGHVPPHGKHGGQNMKDERGWAYYSTSIKQTRRPRPYQWSWKSVIIGIFWWTLMKLTAGMPIPLFFTASSSNGTPTLCCAHPSPFLPWGTALWTGACPHPRSPLKLPSCSAAVVLTGHFMAFLLLMLLIVTISTVACTVSKLCTAALSAWSSAAPFEWFKSVIGNPWWFKKVFGPFAIV